jgi:hypothetical protein
MLDVRPHSKANPSGRQRIALLKELIAGALAEKQTCRILDLGGTYDF